MSEEIETVEQGTVEPKVVERVAYESPGKPKGDNGEDTEWFISKPRGHHFTFELNGKKFEARELSKETVKSITRRIRELGKNQKAIQNKNRQVIDSLRKLEAQRTAQSKSEEPDWELIEELAGKISDLEERQEQFTDEAEPLIDEQGLIYERVCIEALRSWELSEPLSEEAIKDLSLTARRNIGDIILENSVAGGDRSSFTRRPSRR